MIRRTLPLYRFVAITLCMSWATQAQEEPTDLAAMIPGDAMAAVYWAGMNDDTPGYAESKLKAMLVDSGLGKRINDAVVAAVEPEAEYDEEAAMFLQAWRELGEVPWKRQWVFYFQGIDFPGEGGARREPMPRMGFVIEPGDDTAVVRKYLTMIVEEMRQEGAPFEVEMLDDGTLLGLFINSQLAADPAGSLPQADRFAMPGGEAGEPMPIWAYVDAVAIDGVIRDGMQHAGDMDELADYERIVQGLGLESLDRVFYAAGFADTDFRSELFIGAPAPAPGDGTRTGLLALLNRPAIDGSEWSLVPAASTWARVMKFELGRAWNLGIELVKALSEDEDADAEVDEGLASLNDTLGFDLRQDLIGSLGDTWTFYANPGFGGVFGTGVVMVHQPRDAAMLDASLLKLQGMLNDALRENNVGFTFNTIEQQGLTLHSMAAPFVSPAWAVADGRWYLGLTPQAVKVAHAFAQNPGQSLWDAPEFQATSERLGWAPEPGVEPSSWMFTRVKESAPVLHSGWMTLAGFARMAGEDIPFDVMGLIPPLATLTPHLGDAAAASWTDEAGFHLRSISPFPGSSLLSQEFVYSWVTSTMPMSVAVLPSAIKDARDATRQSQSSVNLRQIAIGLISYSADYKDQLPPDLGTIYQMGYLGGNATVFFHPADPALARIEDTPEAELPALINEHSSYLFVRPGVKLSTIENPSEAILAVDTSGASDQVAVLYADGHVESGYGLDWVSETVEEQTGKTLEQWKAAAGR